MSLGEGRALGLLGGLCGKRGGEERRAGEALHTSWNCNNRGWWRGWEGFLGRPPGDRGLGVLWTAMQKLRGIALQPGVIPGVALLGSFGAAGALGLGFIIC